MSSFPNLIFFHDQIMMSNSHYSRRLLLHPMAASSSSSSSSSSPSPLPQQQQQPKDFNNTFDANVVMVLSVLLCALICSLGLNSIIRCALRCSTFVVTDSSDSSGATSSARLANTGIKKKALKKFLVINYADDLKLPGLDTECAICLSDFAPGERVRVLPKCSHGFHVRCIDKWLNSHSSCPTCRHCLIETNKIIGCSSSNPAATNTSSIVPVPPTPPPPPPQVHQQEVVIRIEPLQPEGLIRNHEI